MKIVQLDIANFRGIKEATILFPDHAVLVGDNNSCKSTVLEAIDLALGPERISRPEPIDEHDFYGGVYQNCDGAIVDIRIEVIVSDLSEEQERRFKDHVEWWHEKKHKLLGHNAIKNVDEADVRAALRVLFVGSYNPEEDDFQAETFFANPAAEDGTLQKFGTRDKRNCGFLYLRTLRTGSRALSLERGSLLDIILRLEQKRPQMWEKVLEQLRALSVAEDPSLGIGELLERVQEAVKKYVPSDWADAPRLRVSDLTRQNLRRNLVVFMGTGAEDASGNEYAAPYYHQGTGTINTLVLALLSIIAELKQTVIFAMEEPEIAIPPHTQKRVVESIRGASAQAIFTSHSPFVLEEFRPSEIIVLQRNAGTLKATSSRLPPAIKAKTYQADLRLRACEALLARRVLIVEGATEYLAYRAASRKLSRSNPDNYSSLESLGVAFVNAETQTQVAPLAEYYRRFGKAVYAIVDKQVGQGFKDIDQHCDIAFECPEKGIEDLILKQTSKASLKKYALKVVAEGYWPSHLAQQTPTDQSSEEDISAALLGFFRWQKAGGGIADLLGQCEEAEMPSFIKKTLAQIQTDISPPAKEEDEEEEEAEE